MAETAASRTQGAPLRSRIGLSGLDWVCMRQGNTNTKAGALMAPPQAALSDWLNEKLKVGLRILFIGPHFQIKPPPAIVWHFERAASQQQCSYTSSSWQYRLLQLQTRISQTSGSFCPSSAARWTRQSQILAVSCPTLFCQHRRWHWQSGVVTLLHC